MADAENKLRKRGWSVHSEQDSISVDQPGNGRARLGSEAHSVATADRSLSEAEKQELLASYPTDIIATDSVVVVTETQTKTTEDDVIKVSKDENNGEFSTEDAGDGNEKEGDSDSDGYVAMFGEDNKDDEEEGAIPNDDNPVARKRRKVGDEKLDSTTFVRTEESKKTESEADSTVPGDDTTVVKTVAFNHAKSRLSKWAARLFDPNRPRGLVEPPQVIPLNDEFLTAFGKREKEFDDTIGRDAEIDRSNIDEVDPGGKSSEDAIELDEEEGKKKGAESYEGCKVKITNIGYTTSLELLTKKVQRYGSLVEVNLIMDKDKPNLNIGKAYVTFELAECASDFVDKMNEQTLDGRAIRVAIAASNQRRKSTSGKLGNMMARYWEKDISSKCYRCGEVGHVEVRFFWLSIVCVYFSLQFLSLLCTYDLANASRSHLNISMFCLLSN
uniref:RRM domain-containing protein n=1 Tax=Ditylum brightwellii TaxID=49249 RepID=A0A7S4RX43_9STRA